MVNVSDIRVEELDFNLEFHSGVLSQLVLLQNLLDFIASLLDHIANLLLAVFWVVFGGLDVTSDHIFNFDFLFDLVSVESNRLLGQLLSLVDPDIGMNDRDTQGGGNGDVPHQMLVGEDLRPQLIDLSLGEGTNFIGE